MPHHIHVEEWVKRAEHDYFVMFIKAWIPFNAWYKRECTLAAIPNTSDSACISFVCDQPNVFKTKIISLLNGVDKESRRFKMELAELHDALNRHVIPEPASAINFSTMVPGITSPSLVELDFRSYHYKIERVRSGDSFSYLIRVEDKKTHLPKYTKNLNKWDPTLITSDPDFNLINSDECKRKIIEFFSNVNPKKPFNIVLPIRTLPDGTKQRPAHAIEISKDLDVYFIDDKEKIAKVLIRLLYQLRCELFHASLLPSSNNMEVYEHAYKIQYQLINELV